MGRISSQNALILLALLAVAILVTSPEARTGVNRMLEAAAPIDDHRHALAMTIATEDRAVVSAKWRGPSVLDVSRLPTRRQAGFAAERWCNSIRGTGFINGGFVIEVRDATRAELGLNAPAFVRYPCYPTN